MLRFNPWAVIKTCCRAVRWIYVNIPPMGIKTIFILTAISFGLDARPISYSGGSTLMAFSDNIKNSIYYHYSPSYKYSIGIEKINDKYFKIGRAHV